MLLILVAIASTILVIFVLISPFNHWNNRGVIQYKVRTVWLQNLLIPFRSLPASLEKMYQDFPKNRYCGIYLFIKPILFLRDPDVIKQITVRDFDHFTDHNQFISTNSEYLWERNLFALKGDKWGDMRSILISSFTGSKMKIMFNLIQECAVQFTKYFEKQGKQTIIVEMKDIFARFATDVIASSAFGLTCNSLKDRENEFYMMGKEFTNFKGFFKILKLIVMFIAPNLSKILGLKFLNKNAANFFAQVIRDNVESREKNGIIRPDMLHLLMETGNMDNYQTNKNQFKNKTSTQREKLNIKDITAQATLFFIAGFDTVSTLMCFMAHELAVNIDIQQRLQKEVDETLIDCENIITYEALMNMKYMDMVVSETLRKWPPSIITDRVCVKPYTIKPVQYNEKPIHLRKNDMIWLPIFALHRDPQYYPEPEKFDPERFSNENKSSINPYAFIPFGAGPRRCIGGRFASMEIKLLFFHVLTKFNIVIVEKTKVPIQIAKGQFQLTSEGGVWLGLKSREA